MNEAKQRKLTVQRRTLTLAEFSKRFLDWVRDYPPGTGNQEVLQVRMEHAVKDPHRVRATWAHLHR